MAYFGHVKAGKQWAGICLDCFGERCGKCGNEGFVYHTEVPEITGPVLYLYKAFVWFKKYKILPAPGVWTEQTAKFLKAVEWIEAMNDRLAYLKNEYNEKADALEKKLKDKHAKEHC